MEVFSSTTHIYDLKGGNHDRMDGQREAWRQQHPQSLALPKNWYGEEQRKPCSISQDFHTWAQALSARCAHRHKHAHTHIWYRNTGKRLGGQGIWTSCLSMLSFCGHEQASHGKAIVQHFIKIYCPCAYAVSKYNAGKGKSQNHVPSNKVHIPVPMPWIGFT